MELSQLQYFVAIAEFQNISKASLRLNISQPSLSKSISRLEQELGTKLFDRVGKRIFLNDQGNRFLAGVQLTLQDLEEARSFVENMSGGAGAKLNIGLFCSHSYLDPCIEAFGKQYPRAEFTLYCNFSAMDHLETDQFDMMLYPMNPALKKYKGVPVIRERFRLAVSKTHPLALHAQVKPEQLQREEFVFLRNSGRSLERPYFLCINSGFHPRVKCTTDSKMSHRQMISRGLALGFLAAGDEAFYEEDSTLVLLDIDDAEFAQSILIGFKREKHLSETARLFRDHAMKHFGIPFSETDTD